MYPQQQKATTLVSSTGRTTCCTTAPSMLLYIEQIHQRLYPTLIEGNGAEDACILELLVYSCGFKGSLGVRYQIKYHNAITS